MTRGSSHESPAEHEIVRGDFSRPGLREIVETIGREGIGGRLLLSQGFRQVAAYFQNGELVHAVAENDEGFDELLCSFGWTFGTFVLELEAIPPARTMRMGSCELVLRGMRLRDAWDRSGEDLPSADTLFRLPTQGSRSQGSISLTAVEVRVLELVDSKRTQAEIAHASGLGKRLTAHVLARLWASGLVMADLAREHALGTSSSTAVVHRRASWRIVLGSLNPFAPLGPETGLGDLASQVFSELERPMSIRELCNSLGVSHDEAVEAVELLAESGLVSCSAPNRAIGGLEPNPV